MQREGWIDPNCLPIIAGVFNKSVAEVRGVVSFYADFKTEPPKSSQLKICQAEACQAVGARDLMAQLHEHKFLDSDNVEIEPVYCLGLCPMGPAAVINGTLIAATTLDKIRSLIP